MQSVQDAHYEQGQQGNKFYNLIENNGVIMAETDRMTITDLSLLGWWYIDWIG